MKRISVSIATKFQATAIKAANEKLIPLKSWVTGYRQRATGKWGMLLSAPEMPGIQIEIDGTKVGYIYRVGEDGKPRCSFFNANKLEPNFLARYINKERTDDCA